MAACSCCSRLSRPPGRCCSSSFCTSDSRMTSNRFPGWPPSLEPAAVPFAVAAPGACCACGAPFSLGAVAEGGSAAAGGDGVGTLLAPACSVEDGAASGAAPLARACWDGEAPAVGCACPLAAALAAGAGDAGALAVDWTRACSPSKRASTQLGRAMSPSGLSRDRRWATCACSSCRLTFTRPAHQKQL